MKSILPIIFFLAIKASVIGQVNVGSWEDHLSYAVSVYLAAGDEKIFSSTGTAVMIRDNQFKSLSRLSKANGLSDAGISAIAWSEQEETLIIVYSNTNVDLVRKGTVTNIPDIKNKYIPGLKEIYNVTVSGNNALLSGSFGIVVINLAGRYIADTWKPGPDGGTNAVYETTILGDRIYAATGTGVYSAHAGQTGLSYFGNWDRLDEMHSPGASYNKIATAGTALFVNRAGAGSAADSLFRIIPGQPPQLILSRPSTNIRSVDPAPDGVTVALNSSVAVFSSSGTMTREITGYGWASANPANTLSYNGSLWISDISNGLVSTSDFNTYNNYVLPGPYTNNVADIYFLDASAYVTGGTVDNAWNNVYRPLQVFLNSGDDWKSNILYGASDRDAMRILADPDNPDHYFVSSWGNGLYEFEGTVLVKNYNQYNSPLSSITAGSDYTRICGLAYDRKGNLWMTHSGVSGNLKALMKDGTWTVTSVDLDVPVVGDMVIGSNGFIWATLPRGYGILVYDPNNTPADISDDRYVQLQVEADGYVMNNIYSIAEDKNGNIWVGTDMGPVVYYTPEKVFEASASGTRVKVPRNDGSGLADYLLSTETITSIAVDGANRKWFGTMSSGAYLVSEDGRAQLHNFSSENSPLLSDNITKIAINGITGEVWLGTASGIISFRSDATTGKDDFSGMYVFPNPVREDFEGTLTITGLMESSNVKITDISGNLVYETTSNGGQASWDLMNYKGTRVNTGVYLVFVTSSDGAVSKVTKFLVIK